MRVCAGPTVSDPIEKRLPSVNWLPSIRSQNDNQDGGEEDSDVQRGQGADGGHLGNP